MNSITHEPVDLGQVKAYLDALKLFIKNKSGSDALGCVK